MSAATQGDHVKEGIQEEGIRTAFYIITIGDLTLTRNDQERRVGADRIGVMIVGIGI